MPYRNKEKRYLSRRCLDRTRRHGNWRQTYIDCGGQCIAQINGDVVSCVETDYLELHEIWGEAKDPVLVKFQQRVILCNRHHSLIDDHCHQYTFIQGQYQRSVLADDVTVEILLAGNFDKWVEKFKLDGSRWGCLREQGLVKVEEVVDENTVEIPA